MKITLLSKIVSYFHQHLTQFIRHNTCLSILEDVWHQFCIRYIIISVDFLSFSGQNPFNILYLNSVHYTTSCGFCKLIFDKILYKRLDLNEWVEKSCLIKFASKSFLYSFISNLLLKFL